MPEILTTLPGRALYLQHARLLPGRNNPRHGSLSSYHLQVPEVQHLHMIIMDWNGFDDGGAGQNECVGDIENDGVGNGEVPEKAK